jgi:thioredoxin reductase (NADPH)
MLWEQGDCDRPLFLVLEGQITVLSDTDRFVTAHQSGQFSGDVDLLSGRPTIVKGRATGETRVLELPRERLRALVQTDPDLSEILLRMSKSICFNCPRSSGDADNVTQSVPCSVRYA